MLTAKNYASIRGIKCPNCLSANVERHDLELDNGRAYQNCMCRDCEALWVDVYQLTGYSELELPAKEVLKSLLSWP